MDLQNLTVVSLRNRMNLAAYDTFTVVQSSFPIEEIHRSLVVDHLESIISKIAKKTILDIVD